MQFHTHHSPLPLKWCEKPSIFDIHTFRSITRTQGRWGVCGSGQFLPNHLFHRLNRQWVSYSDVSRVFSCVWLPCTENCHSNEMRKWDAPKPTHRHKQPRGMTFFFFVISAKTNIHYPPARHAQKNTKTNCQMYVIIVDSIGNKINAATNVGNSEMSTAEQQQQQRQSSIWRILYRLQQTNCMATTTNLARKSCKRMLKCTTTMTTTTTMISILLNHTEMCIISDLFRPATERWERGTHACVIFAVFTVIFFLSVLLRPGRSWPHFLGEL